MLHKALLNSSTLRGHRKGVFLVFIRRSDIHEEGYELNLDFMGALLESVKTVSQNVRHLHEEIVTDVDE